jgi:hypothetical protein
VDRTFGEVILHQVLSETWGYPSANNLQNLAGFWQWRALKLKSVLTALKMAACQRTMTSIPGDRQRAEKLMSLIKDHCLTIQEIADEVWISRGSTSTILIEDLDM